MRLESVQRQDAMQAEVGNLGGRIRVEEANREKSACEGWKKSDGETR